MAVFDDSNIKKLITGRVVPHIYSFETNTLPNYLKVGDTYRPVEERLNEWRRHYTDLQEVSRHRATVADDIFFRDYSVHKFLQQNGIKQIPINPDHNIFSAEFFEGAKDLNVADAIADITESYGKTSTYEYYNNLKQRVEYHFERTKDFVPRDNQQQVIDNFDLAAKNGRTNMLMYAVMRFGKSITSMWCAKSIDSKLTVIVSAKADVKSEWKQTVESHKDFVGYRFMDKDDLKQEPDLAKSYGCKFKTGSGEEETCTNIVVFFSLQDLAGSTEAIKKHHKMLQDYQVDLLVIDETHFGARAQVLGKTLAGVEISKEDGEALKSEEDTDDLGSLGKLKPINSKIKLHLSGTPYRILMGSEFAKEDIIAFVQFSDIYEAKTQWSADNLDQDEWDNPYFGFPQMVRFAFNPNESSRKKLSQIPGSKPAELFTPVNTKKVENEYESFIHEDEVTDLLKVLDGSKDDPEILGILNNDTIKSGKLAQHIVIVLPYRASCDALERLISNKGSAFKNISKYEIYNISGFNKKLDDPADIKAAIAIAASGNKKTITLTVNKMLTGATVPQWDTMIYLKGTSSPQEYDQAIFRLQSPWVEAYEGEKGDSIGYDMKPQTLLVDFDPTRLFHLQEMKAFTYGANTHEIGNENIKEFIKRELKISPIISLNAEKNKLIEVTASSIIDIVRKYVSERTIQDDVEEISIDVSLKENQDIYDVISKLTELGGGKGLNIVPVEGEGQDMEGDDVEPEDGDGAVEESTKPANGSETDTNKVDNTFEKQFRTYYVMILLFAFLSDTDESTLTDIINNLDKNTDNKRIARSLGLKEEDLVLIRDSINPLALSSLDYKIQNSDYRANDKSITAEEHVNIAINKFGRLSESEVFTPANIVNNIYDSFDADFWRNSANAKFLDIASKSGSFARGFIVKAIAHGLSIEDIKDNFYSIPTSPAAYEFTRKMYSALGLNIDNIASHFTSFDIIELDSGEIQFLLSQDKRFCDITLSDLDNYDKVTDREREGIMKFTAVVGNPPYQANIDGRGDQPPIYDRFLEAGYLLADVVTMIHPARFLFNAGLTNKSWNQKMLQDKHLKVTYFEQSSAAVFPGTDIKGGVAITFRDAKKEFGGIGVFTSFPELNTILKKVEAKKEDTIEQHITGRGVYRLTEVALSEHPEIVSMQSKGHKSDVGTGALKILKDVVLFDKKPDNKHEYVQILGLMNNRRTYLWIDRRYLSEPSNFNKYKVLLPKANGSGAIGEILSTPLIGEPLIGYTETFIGIGQFNTLIESKAALKYVKSKFARTMLGILKITQDNPRNKWSKVPLQNFTNSSDIDWTKSIEDIDKQLYAKYVLDENEITFIESHVKSMK